MKLLGENDLEKIHQELKKGKVIKNEEDFQIEIFPRELRIYYSNGKRN